MADLSYENLLTQALGMTLPYSIRPFTTLPCRPATLMIMHLTINQLKRFCTTACMAKAIASISSSIAQIKATTKFVKKAKAYCVENVESVLGQASNRDEYDIRELQPDPFPYSFYVEYLNQAHIQAALGAFTNFTNSSNAVGDAFSDTGDDVRNVGSIAAVASLLKRNITVAMYAGDADYNSNWLGGERVADMVNAPGWCESGYVDINTSDGIVYGQVKQSSKFSFSRIYEAGHEVPFYQPLLALELFQRVIGDRDVATGKTVPGKFYRTKGPTKSTYREGNSTMQFEVISSNVTYDTATNKPGAIWKRVSKKNM